MKSNTDKKYLYGLLSYNSINIGDEIQSVACSRFLPQIDELVYREMINSFVSEDCKKTKLIMNAWWMWKSKNFLPSKCIEPLLISMFIRPEIRKEILTENVRKYLLNNGPVGCRDMSTYEWLQNENIPSYFSGCLTLTLQRNYEIPRENYILCVDVKPELVEAIKKRTTRPVYDISRMLSPYYTSEQRLDVAKVMLRLYQDAHLVVSSRLHVILPSLAMETPVLRIISDEQEMGDFDRYKGYETFFNSYTNEEIINNPTAYNFDEPLANPNNHLKLRNDLINKCQKFTGYNNTNSLIDKNINPAVEIIRLNRNSYRQIERLSYWLTPKSLKKVLKNRLKGYNQYDLIGFNIFKNEGLFKLYFNKFKYKLLYKICTGKKKEHYVTKLNQINKYLKYHLDTEQTQTLVTVERERERERE